MAAVLKFCSEPLQNPARPAAGVALCRLDEIPMMETRRFVFTEGDEEFRGVLIHTPRGLRGFADWCPHMSIPLQHDDKELCLDGNVLTCAWHQAQFRTTDGTNLGTDSGSLQVWPVVVKENGWVETA